MTSIDVSARIATDDARRVTSATVTDPHAHERGLPRPIDVVGAYIGLTKPRIIELLLVTTVPAMFLAARGVPDLIVVFSTLLGGCLAAASANVFNCVLDRDIDERMRRTRRRPLPRHAVEPLAATIFGAVLGVAATLWLGVFVNWLSALLALGANAFYVFVYTMWLKRRTSQNIVWGGIAGCFPPLIGWTAVTGSVDVAPFVLFAIVFCWTPPHTWALAMRYREDYAPAHLGVSDALPRGLRRRQGADAAGGPVSARGCAAHPRLLGDHGSCLIDAVADRRHRLGLPRRRHARRCGAALGVLAAAGSRAPRTRRRSPQAHAAVPLVEFVPGVDLRSGCRQPAAALTHL